MPRSNPDPVRNTKRGFRICGETTYIRYRFIFNVTKIGDKNYGEKP